ncbi:MAG: hypothetical protein JST86_13685 [Bacteroidetes bacterium]|nr:hypothetical protein [Bacteroidota bacterium]
MHLHLPNGKGQLHNIILFVEDYRLDIPGGFSLSLTRVNTRARNLLFIVVGVLLRF